MRKFLMTLVLILGFSIMVTLFFIGNPRNPFVKKVTRTAEETYKKREQHKEDKAQKKIDELAFLEQQQKNIAEQNKKDKALDLYYDGAQALSSGENELAILWFDQSLELNSGDAKVWTYKAMALKDIGFEEEAYDLYVYATQLDS